MAVNQYVRDTEDTVEDMDKGIDNYSYKDNDKENDKEQRKVHSSIYRGIGGWLLVVAGGLVVTFVRLVSGVVNTYLPALTDGSIAAFTSKDSPAYSPLWMPIIFFEFFGNLIFIVLLAAVLVHFFMMKKSTPGMIIVFLFTNLIYMVFDAVAVSFLPHDVTSGNMDVLLRDISRALIACFLIVPYLLRSERVGKTFTR